MSEEENQNQGATPTGDNQPDGNQPKATSLVESANAAAERLEKATKEMNEAVAKAQELKAYDMLGGKTDGGEPPKKPVEESAVDYAEKALKGEISQAE